MSHCDSVSYTDFGIGVRRACGDSRIPLSGSFELTFKCNLRCVHCYIPDFSGRNEMTTEEICRILSETAAEGCLWMLLSGGEVLMRPDFEAIYRHAKGLGLLVSVFTNGTLLNERIADLLAEFPPFGIEISLYGMSDATYEKVTGAHNRFARVRQAVELLVARGLKLTLKTVAMAELEEEIPAMRAWAAELGVPFRYDGMIHARLDGSLAPTAARSTPERLVEWDATDPKRLSDWLQYYQQFVKGPQPGGEYLLSCGAGVQSFHIDPKGTLLSCEALPLNQYNLRTGSFREGWYGIVGEVRQRRASPSNVCSRCEIKSLCDRCPATAMLETGSPDGWLPHYCEVTHRRAAVLETILGNPETSARYLAHAEKVASGWAPEGVALPRAQPLAGADGRAATGCASGGCAGGGCGKGPTPRTATPMQIDVPSLSQRPGDSAGPQPQEQT